MSAQGPSSRATDAPRRAPGRDGAPGAHAGEETPGRPSSILLPFLDHLAPASPERAARRARNWLVTGAIGAALLPRSALLGAATTDAVVRMSVAFAVAAVVVHVVRRQPWSAWGAAGAALAASAVGGGGAWSVLVASVVLASLALSAVRRRVVPREDPVTPLRGLSGIAWGFVGVLIVREFTALPIHVPTGSMQPTIFGDRVDPRGGVALGDHIVVDRLAYGARAPRRFEIAVFDFPLHRPTTFVKRVIGLPGETVEIRDGDVWIDGRIASKPPLVQESLWREVFPRPSPTALPKKIAEAWTAADRRTGAGWAVEGDGVKCSVPGGKESVLRFSRRLEQGDLRVRFDVERGDRSWTGAVRVRSRGHLVEARLWSDSSDPAMSQLSVDGRAAAHVPGFADELAVADGVAILRRGGRELLRAEVPTDGTRVHGVELAASHGTVAFRNLRVDQDQRWLPAPDGTATWTVPEDAYFVLGDNAENSEDSRYWTVTEFRVKGRAEPLLAAADYPSETGRPVRNVTRDRDAWVFHDVNGLPRRLDGAAVESTRDGVPFPFVPRSHFLGRAAFVFWPWVSAEGGFRPRILP